MMIINVIVSSSSCLIVKHIETRLEIWFHLKYKDFKL